MGYPVTKEKLLYNLTKEYHAVRFGEWGSDGYCCDYADGYMEATDNAIRYILGYISTQEETAIKARQLEKANEQAQRKQT